VIRRRHRRFPSAFTRSRSAACQLTRT
jgi:hypothetical protein